jgi:hypothetical protein
VASGGDRRRSRDLSEVFDRKVAGDQNGHRGGDLLIAIAIVLIIAAVWDFATRTSRRA